MVDFTLKGSGISCFKIGRKIIYNRIKYHPFSFFFNLLFAPAFHGLPQIQTDTFAQQTTVNSVHKDIVILAAFLSIFKCLSLQAGCVYKEKRQTQENDNSGDLHRLFSTFLFVSVNEKACLLCFPWSYVCYNSMFMMIKAIY